MRVISTQWNRKFLPAALIAVGALLLGFVTAEYAQMYWKQRQLEAEWQAQQERFIHGGPKPNEVAERGFTRLSIPRIDLSAVVVEGTDRRSLLLGPGHLEGSAVPGGPGNSVITGHRDTFFRHIAELKHGDEILVQRNGRSYTYQVTARSIVKPTNIASIQPTTDNRLTLVTCYPTYYIGPAPERLVVVSKLVSEPDSTIRPAGYATPQELPGER